MKKKVIARIFVKNDSIKAFKKQAEIIIQKTRNEEGCLFYSLFEDVFKPGEFLFYEEYADQGALDIHFKSEYLKVFRTSIHDMCSKDAIVDVI